MELAASYLYEKKEHFFAIPISHIIYHDNDILKQFYNIINKENLHILGRVSFEQTNWSLISIKLDKLRNFSFNSKFLNQNINETIFFTCVFSLFTLRNNIMVKIDSVETSFTKYLIKDYDKQNPENNFINFSSYDKFDILKEINGENSFENMLLNMRV